MDLIERVLHLSPDNGNGIFEIMLLLLISLIPITTAIFSKLRRRRQRVAD